LSELRVGCGFDVHRLEPGRPFLVGGLEIPSDRGPVGHSDGDALLHALADALLGAAGLGDLGTLFPDTDRRWAGARSARLLVEVVARVATGGWKIVNVDAVVLCESPRLAPHRDRIRASVAGALGVSPDRVNVKGKTAERLGALGAGEAVAAFATALLAKD
jgi:2-C-methyl-D-erythritol 2,4-cyclodiphosphate synthase